MKEGEREEWWEGGTKREQKKRKGRERNSRKTERSKTGKRKGGLGVNGDIQKRKERGCFIIIYLMYVYKIDSGSKHKESPHSFWT